MVGGVLGRVSAAPASETALEIDAADRELDVDSAADLCCRREQHFVPVGLDSFGEELIIDVGKCRRHCRHGPGRLSKTELLQLLDSHRDTDPVELFLRRRARQASCSGPSRCQPVEVALERRFTPRGVVAREVTRQCGCRRPPPSCRRRRQMVTFHPGTPHQRRLDVGVCAGPCGHTADSCLPLKNRTVSIHGPNGAEVISVIEECTCTHGCYRMALMEQVYDYTDSRKPHIKVVDVGQCIGTCTREQHGRDCVYSDPVTSKCLMSLQYQVRGCVASASREHFYRTEDGREKSLVSISECSCH
ncbi:uncharacterized protein LOC122370034 [Amphibalanus amphitrite]|uniref:uncharacterized protein LOC122370034 n=1 Tax=Amphibalanus amphitrite TaxID=1232801 RepID=UPI001C921BBA|nr:uncharacterized protein LOC122370034 [Amphibalanus amphitrite]